jgi:hypothetical protein
VRELGGATIEGAEKAVVLRDPQHRGRGVQRPGRAVEDDQHAVAGRLHLATAGPLELSPDCFEVLRQELPPRAVAEASDELRRAHQIREEECGEDALRMPVGKPAKGKSMPRRPERMTPTWRA